MCKNPAKLISLSHFPRRMKYNHGKCVRIASTSNTPIFACFKSHKRKGQLNF